MKQLLLILLSVCLAQLTYAQSERRKAEQEQQAARRSNADNISMRAQLSFPISDKMSEDVVWRRDIYREINLNDDANAGLYYPVEPVGSQVNLFTYIFKLFMRGSIRAYEYRLDGNENFEDSSVVKRKAFLDNYHIYYERTNGQVHIDNSDIPSREVTAYYVKESAYYDQSTATFHTKVLALCPIMKREDDFGDGVTSYPLFWIRYSDLAPFLAKQTIMTSNLNNAATMSVDDYFTKNMYRGKIYKTTNMLGRTLSQYCTTDSAMTKEQKRIEKEISDFETNMWGDKVRKDSLDSIAKLDRRSSKTIQKSNRRASSVTVPKTNVRTRRSKNSVPATSASPRVTVRRERH